MNINYIDKKVLMIDPEKERVRIVKFLKETFRSQGIDKAVIGLSGGIDSMVAFYLIKDALGPENIFPVHMYYFEPVIKFPVKNISILPIREPVDAILRLNGIDPDDKIRIGNIAARTRMIILFDLAKKNKALVCGTENKSENLLGYFTRYGDQASDIEPIAHLYKTQVLQLARYLELPREVIEQKPTAGLWEGQTDEGEFGFTYEEADQVLYLYFEQKLSVSDIESKGFVNAARIIGRCKENEFKHLVPYSI